MPAEAKRLRLRGVITDSNQRGLCFGDHWYNWSNYCAGRPAEIVPPGTEVDMQVSGDWIRDFSITAEAPAAPPASASSRPARSSSTPRGRTAEDRTSIARMTALKSAVEVHAARIAAGLVAPDVEDAEDVLPLAETFLAWINKP